MALDQMDFCATISKLLFMCYVSIFKHLALLCSTRYCPDMSEVRSKMFIWHIILAIFSSTYQKLLKLIENSNPACCSWQLMWFRPSSPAPRTSKDGIGTERKYEENSVDYFVLRISSWSVKKDRPN